MAQSTGVRGDFTLGNAGVDLSTKTFLGVYLDTANVVQVSTDSIRPMGILQNKPKLGEACAIRTQGTSKMVVNGISSVSNIAIGDKLKSDASGRGIKASSDGDEVCGIALQASTATDEIIEVAVVNRQG